MVYKWLNIIHSFLLPPGCSLCGGPGLSRDLISLDICEACMNELPWINHACSICGHATDSATGPICGQCLRNPPRYDHSFIPLHYQLPVNHFIISLKFRQKLHFARLLAQLFILQLEMRQQNGLTLPMPDALLPVPLHPRRIRQRGYNQSIEISRFLSRQLKIPVLNRVLIRTRHTLPQSDLPAEQRKANIKGAFSCKEMTLPEHVAIVDDVLTTGQTVNEIARVLRRAGVKHVSVWTMAYASLK
jgi:ComF family protein